MSDLDYKKAESQITFKKHCILTKQHSVDQMTIQEQSNQIEELQLEKEQLKEQLAGLQSQVKTRAFFSNLPHQTSQKRREINWLSMHDGLLLFQVECELRKGKPRYWCSISG